MRVMPILRPTSPKLILFPLIKGLTSIGQPIYVLLNC
jgi:hypothetical protein